MIYFDRSRRADFEHCPRKRWWGYEYRGRGIQRATATRDDWALMTGIGVHAGIGELVQGVEVDHAVAEGIAASKFMDLKPQDEREQLLVNEQIAIIESIVRCWAATQLREFHEKWELLAVEKEHDLAIAPGVVMMVRPDLIVKRRADGAIFTWQFKTSKNPDEKWAAQWPLDQMTLSEPMAVEAALGNKYPADGGIKIDIDSIVKVSGVIIQGLKKGKQQEYPRGSGLWYYDSPLVWAWRKQHPKPHPLGEWSAVWAWEDEDGGHTLGKGWRKVPVWVEYEGGVKAWVAEVARRWPALLASQVVTLEPVLRQPHEQERWRNAVHASEESIRKRRGRVQDLEWNLDTQFPMHTSGGNCIWPYKCEFYSICWENASADDFDRFKPRVVNHPQELVQLEGVR